MMTDLQAARNVARRRLGIGEPIIELPMSKVLCDQNEPDGRTRLFIGAADFIAIAEKFVKDNLHAAEKETG